MKSILLFVSTLCLGLSLLANDEMVNADLQDVTITLRSPRLLRPDSLTLEIKNTGSKPVTVIDPLYDEVLRLSAINALDDYFPLKFLGRGSSSPIKVTLQPKATLRVDLTIRSDIDRWELERPMTSTDKPITRARIFAAYWPAGKKGPMMISNFLPFDRAK